MLGELKVSHLRLSAPAKAASPAGYGMVPAEFQSTDGKNALVSGLATNVPAGDLKVGDELLSPLSTLVGSFGATGRLRVRGCDDAERDVSIRYGVAPRFPSRPPYQHSLLTSPGGERIGYYRLERFADDTVKYTERAMAALAKTDGLIIDMRYNQGGTAAALHLLGYFTAGTRLAMVLISRERLAKLGRMPTPAEVLASPRVLGGHRAATALSGLARHDGQAAFVIEGRGASGYTNPVVVLVGPGTASTAEAFSWGMKLLTPARIIGRPTSGALLHSKVFKLDDGWSVTVPVNGVWGPDGRSYADRAIAPDEGVQWSRADYCAGTDPDIAAALKHHDSEDGPKHTS
jgi:carboxyl-terminal processing protease